MKKGIFIIISIVGFGLNAFSQTQTVDQLKQENDKLKKQIEKLKTESNALKQDTTFLRNELHLCSLYGNSSNNDTKCNLSSYKVSFIESKGFRSAQQVEITVLVEQNSVNQLFRLNQVIQLIDAQGNIYKPNDNYQYGNVQLPTGVPVSIKLVFNNILPGTDLFKILSVGFQTSNTDLSNMKYPVFEIRNIKTKWD